MSALRAGNPTLQAFARPQYADLAIGNSRPRAMTIQGTINASAVMIALVAISAIATAGFLPTPLVQLAMFGGAIGGLILAVGLAFKPRLAPVLGPIYAIIEGLFVGSVSLLSENLIDAQKAAPHAQEIWQAVGSSIVFQAVLLTFGIAGAMLLAYCFRVIRATPAFVRAIIIMTGGYVFLVFGTWIARMFGANIPTLFEMGGFGVAISVGVVVLAAMNLILDFKIIEDGVKSGQPKWMEWYGAFALTVTLVWLYLRVLYLLALLRRND